MLPRRMVAAAVLVAAIAAITAPTGVAAQGLDHCDQAAMAPINIAFLGPAKWATVGMSQPRKPYNNPPSPAPLLSPTKPY